MFFYFFQILMKKQKRNYNLLKISDLTADEDTENEMIKSEKEKKSRYLRAQKKNSSSEFDSDESQERTKLPRLPKIPDKLYSANNKRICESQKVPTSLSFSVEQSKSKCQMSPAIRTKNSYKEAIISKSTERKYCDSLSDENENLQNLVTEKHANKYKESKNLITGELENGLLFNEKLL